jgi:hypothetical protein
MEGTMPERLRTLVERLLRELPGDILFRDQEITVTTYDGVVDHVLARLEPILEAVYYAPCSVCGDARLVPDPETLDLDDDGNPDLETLELTPCPECAGRPPFMVAAESWLQAQTAIRTELRAYGYAPGRTSRLVDAVLAAALGDPPIVPLEIWPATLDVEEEDGGAIFVTVRIADERAVELARRGADVVVGLLPVGFKLSG